MRKNKIIKVRFGRHPLHLSFGQGLYYFSQSVLHSDTLKNAIYASLGRLFGMQALNGKIYDSFIISSALPFFKDECFLPRPQCDIPLRNLNRKARKKIRFVGKSLFEAWSLGKDDFKSMKAQAILNKGSLISGSLSSRYDQLEIMAKSDTDRVDLRNSPPTPYYVEQLRFHQDAGLYFFWEWTDIADEESKNKVLQALYVLADEGIGSDKTYGFGRFFLNPRDQLFEELAFEGPATPTYQMNLGLYRPSSPEKEALRGDLPRSGFQIIQRGGFIAEPREKKHASWRKHSANMFDIGSLLPYQLGRAGEKIDLRPPGVSHPVWREGKTIFLPINGRYVDIYQPESVEA